MKVAIAGAGNVGASIAQELHENGHDVVLIERDKKAAEHHKVEGVPTRIADACEVSAMLDLGVDTYDVVIAATGDDKVNLVVSLLAKTEFAVPRVVARINNPKNEWLFTEAWGVDVSVSTPRLITALVEEAVSVGDLVRLMRFQQGQAALVELTLPEDSNLAGQLVSHLRTPRDAALVAILRDGKVVLPQPDAPIEGGDELFFIATTNEVEGELARIFEVKPVSGSDSAI